MTAPIREPDQIRQDTARKLRSVKISEHFQAILGCLLDEDWTTPRLIEMVITPDGHLFRRCQDQTSFSAFLGAAENLLRNIHGIAPVAALDGDEVGNLRAKVAKIKGRRLQYMLLRHPPRGGSKQSNAVQHHSSGPRSRYPGNQVVWFARTVCDFSSN